MAWWRTYVTADLLDDLSVSEIQDKGDLLATVSGISSYNPPSLPSIIKFAQMKIIPYFNKMSAEVKKIDPQNTNEFNYFVNLFNRHIYSINYMLSNVFAYYMRKTDFDSDMIALVSCYYKMLDVIDVVSSYKTSHTTVDVTSVTFGESGWDHSLGDKNWMKPYLRLNGYELLKDLTNRGAQIPVYMKFAFMRNHDLFHITPEICKEFAELSQNGYSIDDIVAEYNNENFDNVVDKTQVIQAIDRHLLCKNLLEQDKTTFLFLPENKDKLHYLIRNAETEESYQFLRENDIAPYMNVFNKCALPIKESGGDEEELKDAYVETAHNKNTNFIASYIGLDRDFYIKVIDELDHSGQPVNLDVFASILEETIPGDIQSVKWELANFLRNSTTVQQMMANEEFIEKMLKYNPSYKSGWMKVGLGSEEDIKNYFRENPKQFEHLQAPEQVISDALAFSKEIENIIEAENAKKPIEEQTPFDEQLINNGIVKVTKAIDDPFSIGYMIQEGPKMGLTEEEIKKYAAFIYVYKYSLSEITKFAREKQYYSPNMFLGQNIKEAKGLFIPRLLNHDGVESPAIFIQTDAIDPRMQGLFTTIGSDSEAYQLGTVAHESSHAMHYLTNGDLMLNNYGDANDERSVLYEDKRSKAFRYITSPLENVAYAHGTVPYFRQLFFTKLKELLQNPKHLSETQQIAYTKIINAVKRQYTMDMLNHEAARLEIPSYADVIAESKKLAQEWNQDMWRVAETKFKHIQNHLDEVYIDVQAEYKRSRLLQTLKEINSLKTQSQQGQDVSKQLQEAEDEKNNIIAGNLDVDLDLVVQLLIKQFMAEYFTNITGARIDDFGAQSTAEDLDAKNPSRAIIKDQVDWLVDEAAGDDDAHVRPLTTEHLPVGDMPREDRSGFKLDEIY